MTWSRWKMKIMLSLSKEFHENFGSRTTRFWRLSHSSEMQNVALMIVRIKRKTKVEEYGGAVRSFQTPPPCRLLEVYMTYGLTRLHDLWPDICRSMRPARHLHQSELSGQQASLQTPDVHPVLVQCWAIVYDAGPALYQRWVDVWFSLA